MAGVKASHYWRQMTELKKFDFPWILTSWVAAYKKTQYVSETSASLSIWLKSAYEIQMIWFHKKLGIYLKAIFLIKIQNSLKNMGFLVRLIYGIIKISVSYAYKWENLTSERGQFEIKLSETSLNDDTQENYVWWFEKC